MSARIPLKMVDDNEGSLYVSEGKIHPREVSGPLDRLMDEARSLP